VYHLGCLSPPLSDVPEGDWFCPYCASKQGHQAAADGAVAADAAPEPPPKIPRLTPGPEGILHCAPCARSFPSRLRFERHMRETHGPTAGDAAGAPVSEAETRAPAPLASASASILTATSAHEDAPPAPAERKLACAHCSRTFVHPAALQKHILKIHTE
jgi:hypothetical protein